MAVYCLRMYIEHDWGHSSRALVDFFLSPEEVSVEVHLKSWCHKAIMLASQLWNYKCMEKAASLSLELL